MTTPAETARPEAMPEAAKDSLNAKEILTARDVAARLGVGVCRVHQMIRAGELPAVRVGKRGIRIPRRAFEEHVAALNDAARLSRQGQNFAAAFVLSGSILADILTPSAERIAQREREQAAFMQGILNACPPLPRPR